MRVLSQKTEKEEKSLLKKKVVKAITAFVLTGLVFLLVILWAVNTGSLSIGPKELIEGLFVQYSEKVATIYDLRFPRIIISILLGAALAVSGTLFQAVLKNPLTDPGIIGISGGASFAAVLVTAFFPVLFAYLPLFAFAGGLVAFLIVYTLAWKGGISPLRIILVGIAVSTMFSGLSNAINLMSGGNQSSVASIVEGSITMKTWEDVRTALYYIPICLILSIFLSGKCNLLSLDDKTARGIGVNVDRDRMIISMTAVLLASIATAVVGVVSFLGLIVPHIARILMGHNHKLLLPYSMLLGATIYLIADTVGRAIAAPYEINASIIMAVIGGPFFILLLRRQNKYGG
ncbi:iron ABC transporter permease [Candidatus Galacturonibacter soehngenii]|uniref:Probable heme-iron transport system permease protein IsdF n=1 Tax=Candidatus Galacturonatibacter soehngenii TaxID=2307010 RepID=A0A7V7UAI5_9FIRM|nr:iron ABC transporter permease [Candidatus Galacturonibacter soehngenii]